MQKLLLHVHRRSVPWAGSGGKWLVSVTMVSQAFRDKWGSPAGRWNHILRIQYAFAEMCVCVKGLLHLAIQDV